MPDPEGLGPFDARPSVTWSVWEALLAYAVVGVVLAQMIVAVALIVIFGIDVGVGAADGASVALTIVVDLVTLAGLAAWLRWRHPGWLRLLWIPPAGRRVWEWATGYGMGLLLYLVVAFGVGAALTIAFRAAFGQDVQPPEQLSSHLSSLGKVGAAILAIVVAPLTEELFFRGMLFRSIRDRWGFWAGAISSSVLFGLAHYVASPWRDALLLQAVMVFTGFGLCWIYERRGTIVGNIGAHMAFNTIGLLLILSFR
ncbi:MAG: type II CAAX endopeptidase family protein [Actinomycetota bacterium]